MQIFSLFIIHLHTGDTHDWKFIDILSKIGFVNFVYTFDSIHGSWYYVRMIPTHTKIDIFMILSVDVEFEHENF